MSRAIAFVLACATVASAATNLARNPSFELDADGDGTPDAWAAAGDSGTVAQRLSLDAGRQGGHSARLACTRFRKENPASHAMICQLGVPVTRGRAYHVGLWARGESIAGDVVSIALSDTATWSNCGLSAALAPSTEWRRYDFLFRATRDCGEKSRFQIWFASTGTLWLDDVVFEEAGSDYPRPGRVVAPAGRRNLVPNASFECGGAGWGSAEAQSYLHWATRLNRRFGSLDAAQAKHGACSFRIRLSPETVPVAFFDYFDLVREPIWAPLLASLGYIEVVPGKRCTLSAWMKAARAGTPARLMVREFERGQFDQAVTLSERWERHTLTFTPSRRWCYVLAGPDLRPSDATPKPPRQATVWVDAVQLEQAPEPSAFVPRELVELGVATDRPGNVFGWDEAVALRITAAAQAGTRAEAELWLTDFSDREVWREKFALEIPAKGRVGREVKLAPSGERRGFLRLHARLANGPEQTLRLAVIPVYKADDSRFGVNHAYPWPHLLDLCRKAGLVWVRDWSLKWKDIEPVKGRFTFTEADHQIDRPLRHGLRVLAMPPFPSAPWSSTASPELKAKTDYMNRRLVVALAPRDQGEFGNYIARTVAHYRDRVEWFQVFNEPIFTTYSLPRKHGYTGADYAKWTRAFVRAARRAAPDCKILAGIGYLREGQIMEDFEQFFAGGTLGQIDGVDIHHYPRIRPPEFAEPLLEGLNAMMDRHGGRKPIWITEYGYYADDEPWAVPMPNSGFNQPLADERRQAAYAVRWAAILLANGVDKIFYHAGTAAGVNRDSLQGVFYEYAGEPHKIYPAQAVLAHLLSPATKFVRKLKLPDGPRGYAFSGAERAVAVVWAPSGATARPLRVAGDGAEVWDLMGRRQKARQFTPAGVPVYIVGRRIEDVAVIPAAR